MSPTLQAQASQAAQQGQDLYAKYNSQADQAKADYGNYSQQVTDTNKKLTDQAAYMQGEGSGENTYNRTLEAQKTAAGYNPQQLSDANSSLFKLTGALNSANSSFNTPGGVGAYGISAPALASYAGSILTPLTTGVSNANTQVGVLNNQLNTLQTGASQATSAQVQSEQNVVTALNQAVVNYQTQAATAQQNMQFYSNLAQQQGGLNAQQQANYAQAQASLAAAQQAIAQSKLILSQTTGQNLNNQQTQAAMTAGAAKTKATATAQASKSAEEAFKRQGMSKVATQDNGTPVYSAQF